MAEKTKYGRRYADKDPMTSFGLEAMDKDLKGLLPKLRKSASYTKAIVDTGLAIGKSPVLWFGAAAGTLISGAAGIFIGTTSGSPAAIQTGIGLTIVGAGLAGGAKIAHNRGVHIGIGGIWKQRQEAETNTGVVESAIRSRSMKAKELAIKQVGRRPTDREPVKTYRLR